MTFDDKETILNNNKNSKMEKRLKLIEKAFNKKEEQKLEIIYEDEEILNEEGIDKESIDIIMKEAKCSRRAAITALKKTNGDIVEALLIMEN